jgi:hypothetical protein
MSRSLWLQDEPCRYCFELDDEVYVTPCSCSGSLDRVHLSCLKKGGVQICPTCKTRFTIDLGMPDRASTQCWLDSFHFSSQDSSNTLYQEYLLCEDYAITRREVPHITETAILHTNMTTERSSQETVQETKKSRDEDVNNIIRNNSYVDQGKTKLIEEMRL